MTTTSEVYGLILMGGQSTRMGQDKAGLDYHGKPQAAYIFDLVSKHVPNTYVSIRPGQTCGFTDRTISDKLDSKGPINGILSAMMTYPEKAWLFLGCDLPMVSSETIAALLKERDPQKSATAFIGHKDLPEPLMAIWEPHAIEALENHYLVEQKNCPRKFLINSDIKLIQPASEREVFNANSPEEYQRAKEWIK